MKQSILLLILLTILSGCSLLSKIQKEPEISIHESQLNKVINKSIEDIINGQWLSDYLTNNNQRPILMTSKINSSSNILFDNNKAYEEIDLSLIKSGQVRVVKTNYDQRILNPSELAHGKSVDFVLSPQIIRETENAITRLFFLVSIWEENSSTPLLSIKNQID